MGFIFAELLAGITAEKILARVVIIITRITWEGLTSIEKTLTKAVKDITKNKPNKAPRKAPNKPRIPP